MKLFFKKLWVSFGCALRGWMWALRNERNMKIHTAVTLCVTAAGFILKITSLEWIAILICIGLVFSAELLNTAIEQLSDFVEPNMHPKVGIIKDIAAAGVFICAIISVITGIIVFVPKIMSLL
ncbi:MAG: diacylglycerol kinase family protein [Prevotellaceae bacterium]|jgi:diacylglycerol kinase|nr:diacylglycerol kinase family protein [Prevotellaceae bacterium]